MFKSSCIWLPVGPLYKNTTYLRKKKGDLKRSRFVITDHHCSFVFLSVLLYFWVQIKKSGDLCWHKKLFKNQIIRMINYYFFFFFLTTTNVNKIHIQQWEWGGYVTLLKEVYKKKKSLRLSNLFHYKLILKIYKIFGFRMIYEARYC